MTEVEAARAAFEAHFATCLLAEPRVTHHRVCTAGLALKAAKYDASAQAVRDRARR